MMQAMMECDTLSFLENNDTAIVMTFFLLGYFVFSRFTQPLVPTTQRAAQFEENRMATTITHRPVVDCRGRRPSCFRSFTQDWQWRIQPFDVM
mmetsp:Transcript_32045/g.51356  ORF Transcript_32045/g.51356 Transcript_32045/m.51356 type:complete len:93 (-) Transcript_32045:279-557(-)